MINHPCNPFLEMCFYERDSYAPSTCSKLGGNTAFGVKIIAVTSSKSQWVNHCLPFTPLRPRDAYMHQWTMPSLVEIMACRLLGAKPLSEPMLTYSQLGHKKQNSVKHQSQFNVSFRKMRLKMLSGKWRSFCLGLNVLNKQAPMLGLGLLWRSLLFISIKQCRLNVCTSPCYRKACACTV